MTTLQKAFRYRWDDLEKDFPMDLIERRRIIGEKFMVSDVFLHKGFKVPTHKHDNEQMAIVLSGRVRFGVGEGENAREEILEGGEVLHLPANVAHSAEALEDTRIFDIFSPVSEATGIDQG